jgi:hypothetical protein
MYTTQTIIEDGKEYKVSTWNGNKNVFWVLNGKIHREKGPAFYETYLNNLYWYQNSHKHRIDGPAHITCSGEYRMRWYINDKRITEQMHTKIRMVLAFGLDKI